MGSALMFTGFGIKTRYKFLSVHPETGRETVLSGWFENTLLTSGRNEMANRDWFDAVQVGTDNTAPSSSQTALLGYVAGTATIEEDVAGAQSSAPNYGWRRKRFRFPIGAILVNTIIKEVGIGWATASGDNLATRALTEDIDGNTTTVTWKADEYLDVVVEVRYYPPTSDATGTVVFNSVTYNYIVRASEITSVSAWGQNIGSKIESLCSVSGDWPAYDDDIGTTEQSPSGVSVPADTADDYTNAYSNNSYQITFGINIGPGTNNVNGWSLTTGKLMRSVRIKTTGGWYQVQFDSQVSPGNGVPKTSGFTLEFQMVLGWAEQVIP